MLKIALSGNLDHLPNSTLIYTSIRISKAILENDTRPVAKIFGIFEKKLPLFFSWDGAVFHNHASTQYDHHLTKLTKIDNVPIVVGGPYTDSNRTETYSIQENKWTRVEDYPFAES